MHMNTRTTSAIALLLTTAIAPSASAAQIYSLIGGVGTTNLISYSSASPGTIATQVPLTGFPANDLIAALDFRPATGQLYGLGQNRLYTINPATGAVAVVGGTTLSRTFPSFGGFDFDPVADVIRFVDSSNGVNLTIHPDTAAITLHTAVAYAPADPRFATTPSIGGTAFSNNLAGATSSTQYNIDLRNGFGLATQAGASGILTSVGSFISGSGNTSPFELDISPAGEAFALIGNTFDAGNNVLYSVNLTTGVRSRIDIVGNRNQFINARAIAIPTNPVIPEPSSLALQVLPALATLRRRR